MEVGSVAAPRWRSTVADACWPESGGHSQSAHAHCALTLLEYCPERQLQLSVSGDRANSGGRRSMRPESMACGFSSVGYNEKVVDLL